MFTNSKHMKSDILFNSLLELGLKEFEAQLYCAILRLQKPTIKKLSEELGVERLTVYRGLDKLKQAGLFEGKVDYSRKLNLEPPSKVIDLLKQKQSMAKNLADSLTSLLPDLLSQYHQNQRQPKVRFFETRESFMSLLDESVNEAEGELYFLGSPQILNFVPEYMQIYIKNRQKKHIISNSISFRDPLLSRRGHKEEFRRLKWLPVNFNVPAAFLAYGNKVAIWNTALPKIIVIEDKIIFEFFKTIYEIIWQSDQTRT